MDTAQNAKEIFLRMVDEVPQEEWTDRLDDECGENEELKGQVAALLEAHADPGSFLDHPAEEIATAEHHTRITEKPGEVIERYKLLEQIGEGGFGVVYMAEQTEPVHRRVALKIIKPGMDTKEVVARFEAERQALALMEHPNIARVLDAGTTESGRPYFVMELVRGIPIVDYCDKHSLPTKDRLQLFIDVCHGVQHAHQKGIIHRDIKPSNILVTLHDGVPVPKVIDFGIAKATSQRLTEKTLFTSYGQFIGTPQYMSPEQSEMSGLDIDTRCDIYALGALLYELLTGSPPFDPERLRSAGFVEVLRIIREEEPPKPSQRLSTRNSLPSITTSEKIEPKKLALLFRGELDWVVMKALEKDRSRRYETANGLASDIQRYLNDEPVTACPPSARYRFLKFTRRNKVALATVSIVAATLIVGLVGTTWQAIRAKRAERVAQANLQGAVVAREQAESERERADENFRRARQTVDDYFTLVSESTLLDEEGMQPLRKQLLESALQYYEEFSLQQTDDPELLAELAATQFRIAITQIALQSEDWLQPLNTSLDILARLLQEGADSALLATHSNGVFKYHGFYDIHFKDTEEAIFAFERGTKILRKLAAGHPDVAGFQHDLAGCHLMAGKTYEISRQWKPAISHYQIARQIWETLIQNGGNSKEYAGRLGDVYQFLRITMIEAGRENEYRKVFREAITMLRAVYGNDQPELANLLRLAPTKSNVEKEKNLREAIGIYERALSQVDISPRSHPEVRWNLSRAHNSLGGLFRRTGRMDAGQEEILVGKQLITVLVEQNPRNQQFEVSLAAACHHLGITYHAQQRVDEALTEYLQAWDHLKSLLEKDPTDVEYYTKIKETLRSLGNLYEGTGRLAKAEETYRQALMHSKTLSNMYPVDQVFALHVVRRYRDLIRCFFKQKKHEEAVQFAQEALDFCRNGDDKVRPALQAELPALETLMKKAKVNDQPNASKWQQRFTELIDSFRKKHKETVQ